jgi:phosphoribosylaminoimidazole carboxylase (NCAIR synthetase)
MRLGIMGSGQLAWMLTLEGKKLGLNSEFISSLEE